MAPFSEKLVERVRSGQFVDMKELLMDNVPFSSWGLLVASVQFPETLPSGGEYIGYLDIFPSGLRSHEGDGPKHSAGLQPVDQDSTEIRWVQLARL